MKRLTAKSLTALLALLPGYAMAAGEGDSSHLPSLAHFIVKWLGPEWHWVEDWVDVIFGLLTTIVLASIVTRVYARREMIPGKLQNFLELLVEGLYNFIHSILGKDTRRYIPLLGTLFLYILINNLWGILPLGHSPSTSLEITLSMAIVVFFVVQYTAIKRTGLLHYADHLIGSPRGKIMWIMSPLLIPIFIIVHVVGEFAKPASLALRLFGNITGEDILVAAFVGLGIMALSFAHSPIGLPLNVPFILLGLLLSTVQALVFTLLSTIYILLMIPADEGHH